jgi:hypothetical protein
LNGNSSTLAKKMGKYFFGPEIEVLVLGNLPMTFSSLILAHELMHVWILQYCKFEIKNQQVLEGLCELFAFLWLLKNSESLPPSELAIQLRRFFENSHPVCPQTFPKNIRFKITYFPFHSIPSHLISHLLRLIYEKFPSHSIQTNRYIKKVSERLSKQFERVGNLVLFSTSSKNTNNFRCMPCFKPLRTTTKNPSSIS